MLEFFGDAISLSGLAGTKLKCDILGAYYPFWWSITSGGKRADYRYPTAIVELHAGTGEVYIKDIDKIVLGSAGHALDLKVKKAPVSENLKILLVEENKECCAHLKNVIRRRWPEIPVERIEGPWVGNKKVYLLNMQLDDAISIVKRIPANSIYFFDPLRSVEWITIEKVATSRIRTFYQTGTEFILFLFTSDWFLGRDNFAALPGNQNEKRWSEAERRTVEEADSLFGDKEWRKHLLCDDQVESRQKGLIEIYKKRLRKWFRYILPLPFNPKPNQIFHLVICSNFEAGVRMNRHFYSSITDNPPYSPESKKAYNNFMSIHPELFKTISGIKRPLQWKTLWRIITQHEDGICDSECRDLKDLDNNIDVIQKGLDWLCENNYLELCPLSSLWDVSIPQYRLKWGKTEERLKLTRPAEFQPISQEQLHKKLSSMGVKEELTYE